MSEQDLIRIAHDVVDGFNAGDWERLRTPLTPNTVYNELGTQRSFKGSHEMVEALKSWKQALPDARAIVTNSFASGNKVTMEITWKSTHTGPLVGPAGTIPASGKTHTTPSAWVLEFEGDKIKESRHYFDMVTFLTQIGAMPQ